MHVNAVGALHTLASEVELAQFVLLRWLHIVAVWTVFTLQTNITKTKICIFFQFESTRNPINTILPLSKNFDCTMLSSVT